MQLASVLFRGRPAIALRSGADIKVVLGTRTLDDFLASGEGLAAAAQAAQAGEKVSVEELTFLPPLVRAPKIICLGLNYSDHADESGFQVPEFPTVFARFNSSLIGNGQPIIRPTISEQLDYEGELVAVIGKGGKNIARADALNHVAAYSIFNDASIRDIQLKTPQWTVGKNFDASGAFGPWLVTPDVLPPGAAGLNIETRLNGQVVQHSNTSKMIFSVVDTITLLSTCFTLEAGDVLVMGTPDGVGLMRKPPLFMKDGDICEVEIEGLGVLANPIKAE